MATFNQIYELVNEVSAEAFGETSFKVHNLTDLIAMGQELSDFGTGTRSDIFLKTLVDRIARTLVRTLDFELEFPEIITDNFNYGCVLQKLSFDIIEATDYEPTKIGENGYTPNQFAVHKPTVHQTFFEGSNGWSIKGTIPDNLYSTAFDNATNMTAFVDGLMTNMQDSMTIKINDMCRMAVDNFIAEKIYSGKNVVHLLTDFNHEYDESLTFDDAMKNAEFFRYVSTKMNEYMDFMSKPSKLFNEDGYTRATRRDNMHVFLLNALNSRFTTYLQSDTFHKELVELPLFKKVTFWQSPNGTHEVEGETVVNSMPDILSASTIKIETSEGHEVTQTGVIGAFIDRQAIGTTIFKKNTTTDRNNDGEYTNYSYKCRTGHYNDMSENAIIFCVD